ncbi:uncharacterized protein LOC114521584 [Dendronephthya gigantea]|uniref:uncharacterized protein LOC114521584 n=1 Tax=Dendronephthya gigantea TaxID=151771 RepID=UPI00106BD6BD|nr:uncharacterized protein LOC114521584 [Dendronephthya gigantea]
MEQLYKLLNDLKDASGDFACSGFLPELCLPGLVIENVGHISLPVQDEQAQKIIEVAKKAPFGLGDQTLVDETVRKTWQLDPKQITIKNDHFLTGVENVVSSAKKNLGCDKKAVKAKLYKVLLYEKGGHFKAHRDTEKENGMFATMVLQLPSKFEGGKITVRHAGDEKVVKMDGERSSYCCKYAAHYSDCEHEVSKIVSGYRLALVYSLCWTAGGTPPSADTGKAIVQNVAKILPQICTGSRNLFAWFLSHKYSEHGLSGSGIDALKGPDEVVARALQQANELLPKEQQFNFYIAEVKRELQQFGDFWDENSWSGGFEPNGDEEEEVSIENWFQFDGKVAKIEVFKDIELDIENDVVNLQKPRHLPLKDAIQRLWGEPDDEENTGPTGNEGATQTYWYNNYAIFAWQKDNEIILRCKLNGYQAAVDWVSNQLKSVEKKNPSSSAYQKVMSDLKMIIDYAISEKVSLSFRAVHSMLKTLTDLRTNAVMLSRIFITDVMGKVPESKTSSLYCLCDNHLIPPLLELTTTLGWPSISEAIKKLFDLSPVSQYGNWAEYLKSLFQRNVKKVLQKDDCFIAMVTCLAQKVEDDARNKQLESVGASRIERIASLLFAIDNFEILTKFTNAILKHCQQSHTSSLLQNLIRLLEKEKLGGNQFWNQLLNIRISQLEDVEKSGIPPFTWNQDDAVFNNHPQVQTFLRGPNQTMKYQAFTGIAQARKFANSYFGGSWARPGDTSSYTATATTAGVGRHAYVLIEKTRAWYDRKFAPVQRQLDELNKLRGMVKPESAATTSSETGEPQAKRKAVGVAVLQVD